MEEMIRFVMLARSTRFTVTELCVQFGITRKTGYKHLERYAAEGLKGLQPRSHRPHRFPQRTEAAVTALILAERRLHEPPQKTDFEMSNATVWLLRRS